jgi:chaperonin GroES
MVKTIAPAPQQLFCKPDEAETTTKSGFILQVTEKPRTAEVINVGNRVSNYKQKDTIVYKSYASSEIKLDGEDYFLISEEDVLGVVVEA